MAPPSVRTFILSGLILAAAVSAARADISSPVPRDDLMPWPEGALRLQVHLPATPVYSDGRGPAGVAADAIVDWNGRMARLQFTTAAGSGPVDILNLANEVAFGTEVLGYTMPAGVLAVTVSRFRLEDRQRLEADIVVNSAVTWDSYRGPLRSAPDLRRVLVHELGHVVGFTHPDERGRTVASILNSRISDLDALTAADEDAIEMLYGRGPASRVRSAWDVELQPRSQTVIEGDPVRLELVRVRGTAPFSIQWLRDGAPIEGATGATLAIPAMSAASSGTYSVRISNAAGVTEAGGTLLINLQPGDPQVEILGDSPLRFEIGGPLQIVALAYSYFGVTSLQWWRNGAPIPGATGNVLEIPVTTAADSGTYELRMQDARGRTAVASATVVGLAAGPPVVVQQPRSFLVTSLLGGSGASTLRVRSTRAVTARWFCNGVLVRETTLDLSPSRPEEAMQITVPVGDPRFDGNMVIELRNELGVVRTLAFEVVQVRLPLPWSARSFPSTATLGEGYWVGPSGFPFSTPRGNTFRDIRAFREGIPVPESEVETRTDAQVRLTPFTAARAGDYLAELRGRDFLVTSTTAPVAASVPSSETAFGGLGAVRGGDIVFVPADHPARILRFDLAAGRWLEPVAMPARPLTVAASEEHLYIAGATLLWRMNFDGTGLREFGTLESAPMPIGAAPGPNTAPVIVPTDRSIIVFMGALQPYNLQILLGTARVFRRTDGAVLQTNILSHLPRFGFFLPGPRVVQVFGRTYAVAADGTVPSFSGFSQSFGPGRRMHLPLSDQVVASDGTLQSGALRPLGSIGEPIVVDVAEDGKGLIAVLRGFDVLIFDSAWRRQASARVPDLGGRLFFRGGDVHVFQPNAQGGVSYTRLRPADFQPMLAQRASPFDGSTLRFTPDEVVMDRDDVAYILVRSAQNILRWSARDRRFLPPIPLSRAVNSIRYWPERHALQVTFSNGWAGLVRLGVAVPVEEDLPLLPGEVWWTAGSGLITVSGPLLAFVEPETGRSIELPQEGNPLISSAGAFISSRSLLVTRGPAMLGAAESVIGYELGRDNRWRAKGELLPAGSLPPLNELELGLVSAAPDGSAVVTGVGTVAAVPGRSRLGDLGRGWTAAAWTADSLYLSRERLSGIEVARFRRADFRRVATTVVPGRLRSIHALSDGRVLVVGQRTDTAFLEVLGADLVRPEGARRLSNLSTRAMVGQASNVLVPGFVIEGPAPQRLLARAAGPALEPFGVPGVLANPAIRLFRGSTVIASNDDWHLAPNASQVRSVAESVGAFPFPEGGRDAALLVDLAPGLYTLETSGVGGGTGVGLVELYVVDAAGHPSRLVNISARARVAAGSAALVPGVVIDGDAPKRVLIRAVGPGLSAFGVPDVLPNPRLRVFRGQRVIADNDNWQDEGFGPEAAAVAARVGAFSLADGSLDAAIVLALPPGVYTVEVADVGGAAGVALMEVYVVP